MVWEKKSLNNFIYTLRYILLKRAGFNSFYVKHVGPEHSIPRDLFTPPETPIWNTNDI